MCFCSACPRLLPFPYPGLRGLRRLPNRSPPYLSPLSSPPATPPDPLLCVFLLCLSTALCEEYRCPLLSSVPFVRCGLHRFVCTCRRACACEPSQRVLPPSVPRFAHRLRRGLVHVPFPVSPSRFMYALFRLAMAVASLLFHTPHHVSLLVPPSPPACLNTKFSPSPPPLPPSPPPLPPAVGAQPLLFPLPSLRHTSLRASPGGAQKPILLVSRFPLQFFPPPPPRPAKKEKRRPVLCGLSHGREAEDVSDAQRSPRRLPRESERDKKRNKNGERKRTYTSLSVRTVFVFACWFLLLLPELSLLSLVSFYFSLSFPVHRSGCSLLCWRAVVAVVVVLFPRLVSC